MNAKDIQLILEDNDQNCGHCGTMNHESVAKLIFEKHETIALNITNIHQELRDSLLNKLKQNEVNFNAAAAGLKIEQDNRKELQVKLEASNKALQDLLNHYVSMVESGDAGFWDAEKEDVVINARKVLK